MPLNHKRRIFRPAGSPVSGLALPGRGLLLAAAGGVAALAIVSWTTLRSSQAPAHMPTVSYLAAEPAQVAVIDGGTLRLRDRVVHLAGINPPARGETCRPPGGSAIDCGAAAANALAVLVRDNPTECSLHGHDQAGRPLGTCTSHGAEVNQALVADGWARADPSNAPLVQAEAQARAARRGLWATLVR